ncbi:hypothetical protein BDR06DRAFT_771289 [Suillus hirtellus]|nr:hypothetical protein BDR06DRAFT_771289 [Suillus hirtellus]
MSLCCKFLPIYSFVIVFYPCLPHLFVLWLSPCCVTPTCYTLPMLMSTTPCNLLWSISV